MVEENNKDKYVVVKNLHKHYKNKHILKGIDFSINKGECLGFIGHNGAGKTTTIKILIGVNQPDKGSYIRINGETVEHFKNENKVSYLPEKVNFQEYLTGREYLEFIVSLNELGKQVKKDDIEKVLKKVAFPDNFISQKIKTYSKGMQQRLGLAGILLNKNNELIVLDEPVSGLDPVGQEEMINIIKILKDEGKTIFITTHQMSEVEQLCDNIILLEHGKVKNKSTVKDAINKHGNLTEYYKYYSTREEEIV